MMGGVYSDGEMGLKCQAPDDQVGYTLADTSKTSFQGKYSHFR
jgi:hypothetical protein